jgi:hypothetical protein
LIFEPPPGENQAINAEFGGRADAEGHFALPIRRRDGNRGAKLDTTQAQLVLRRAVLTIDGGSEVPRRRLELSGSQLPSPFDFGELVLERGATLHFVAVDSNDAPVLGAVGRLDGERSEPTDEFGRATIFYAPGVGRPLSVQLAGYTDGRAEVPAKVDDALRVQLQRSTRLSVTVRDPAGAPASGLTVELRVQTPAGDNGRNNRSNRPRDQRSDEQGRVEFSNVPPELPLRVIVRDAVSTSVAEQQLTLQIDEWREIELSIPHALLAFSGVVRDELGLALAEASVEFLQGSRNRPQSVGRRSDGDGMFEFSGLSQASGMLRVRKTGFAPLTVPDFQIPADGTLVVLRLDRGLRLVLSVVDERGRPIRADSLRLEMPGERAVQGRRSDDAWQFSNLPRTSMSGVASVGNREFRQAIEPLNGDQEFRVPAQGGLELTLRLQPASQFLPLRLNLRARDDRRVLVTKTLTQDALQTALVEPLLPGEYTLNVVQFVRDGQRADWVVLGSTQRIKIPADGNLRLEVAR